MIEKEKNKTGGKIIEFIVPLVFPLIVFFVAEALIKKLQPGFSKELNFYSAMTFAGAIGVVFALSCALVSKLPARFAVVRERIAEFFCDARLSVKTAFGGYISNVREKGADFWIPIFYILVNVIWFLLSLSKLLPLIEPYL